jgi:opacity protein-like surface antigen
MKRVLALAALSLVSVAACAEGYVGAVLALTRVEAGCPSGYTCNFRGHGGKLYAGTKLSADRAVDFSFGKIDAIEVSYLKFGGTKADLPPPDAFNPGLHESTVTDAIAVSAVAHVPVADQFSVVGKLGLAYVSSTIRGAQDTTSLGGVSENHLKPYIALGLEYDIPNVVKIVGSMDLTGYQTTGRRGPATMIGIGAETNF